MHLPDHYLDSTTIGATALLAGGAVAYSLMRLRREPATGLVPAAAVAAVVFAAQIVNFPVASETSGHVVGGVLAGLLLGPWAGSLAMATVLAVQALVLGDGGILALGANILNMGVVAVWLGVAVDRLVGAASRAAPCLVRLPGAPASLLRALAAALAAWLGVQAAALLCSLEMAASGTFAVAEVVPRMLSIHAIIGLGEAAITALVAVAMTSATFRAPGGISKGEASGLGRAKRGIRPAPALSICGFATAAFLVALSPIASTLPDGLEHVTGTLDAKGQTSVVPMEVYDE